MTTRRLAAILAADVVGFSKLIGEDEAGTLAALREIRKGIVNPVLAGQCHENAGALGGGSIMMANDNHLVCSSPISFGDHPARSLALCPVHAQLSRR